MYVLSGLCFLGKYEPFALPIVAMPKNTTMHKSKLVIMAGVLFAASAATGVAQTSPLTVLVEKIAVAKGRIHVGIYKDAASFPKKKYAFAGKEMPVNAVGSMEVIIPDLAPGRYAVAVFQDTNDNGKLDTNVFGVPIEPYGFSNGTLAKWGSPKFESAAFLLSPPRADIRIRLAYWADL